MWQMRQQVATSTLVYTTANAQRANITLPDGSVVALDVGSRLTVPSDYAAGHHTVQLIGKGMFTVQRHDGTPLTVLAGPASVHVLGTSFVVQHYPTDSLATVAVRNGKVSVGNTVVAASQQVTVGAHGAGVVHAMDPGQFSFVRGVLVLNAIPMHQAIVELDRWYDVDIRLGDPSLAARHIAGEYAAGSLADLSDILMGSLGVRVERHGRVLTLYPR
jgi:ferric-dicitrate binding protein FerR (iron transport regulator)